MDFISKDINKEYNTSEIQTGKQLLRKFNFLKL